MPFPKTAQRRGGSRPATDRQKEAARATALQNKPWELRRSQRLERVMTEEKILLNPLWSL